MKNKITLFVLSLLFTTAIFAQEKRQTKFIKLEESSQHRLLEAKQLIKEKLKLSSDDDLVKIKTEIDQIGFTHEKYQQYFQGVKVEFGIYNVHAKNGTIKTMGGELFSPGKLNTTPVLSNDAAFQNAIASVGAEKYLWDSPEEAKIMDDYKKPNGELVVFPGRIINDKKSRLAYKFDIYATQPLSRDYIYVDAHTGDVIYKDAIIKHVDSFDTHSSHKNENVNNSIESMMLVTGNAATRYSGNQSIETTLSGSNYVLRETLRGNGIETYDMNLGINYNNAVDFTDNDNNWTAAEHDNATKDNAALDAHWGAEKTYDYFSQTFNRNSYDNNGAKIKSYVHFDLVEYGYSNQDNAFWNGSVMTYGDGTSFSPLTSIDIAAHEIGHAVCENTANLTYSYESGAMNEGFSDIWAASVEYFADPSKQTWVLGEEIGGPIRSLSDPNAYGQPDTYLGTDWYTGSLDNGGVHYNSGVLNHWFYILTVGKSGTNDNNDSYSVTGIGIDKAAAIAYRLESVYLSASSQYSAARTNGIQAAEDLYGAGSAEVIATTNAWYAVGIGSEYVQTCALGAPSNLAPSSIGDNNFTVSWNSVSGAVSYDVTVNGSPTTVSGTSYTASGLTVGTAYSVSVVANCSTGGSGASSNINVTTTGTAPVTYCDSASTNINDEYIGRVQLGAIDNTSGGQFYTDFTNISTDLNKGDNYTITVTPTWTGTVYSEGYSVWIDYNKDGDFTDSGEQVWSQAATQTTPISGSFTVSTSAANGATRMRVSMKYNGVPTSCETFTYGEVEDYIVNIGDGTPDTTAPVITLNGASTINLEVGDTYNELGATATDDTDGDLTSSIVVTGTVNTATAGTYTINYNVSDAAGNAATQVSRTIIVTVIVDTTAPVITLNGASTINLEVGDTYNELGATATDDTDGDLTSSIVVTGTVNTATAGTYTINYNVSDASGNAATQVSRTIIVTVPIDTTAPVITLNGASTINLEVGDTYNELGATATDDTDGDLTSSIVITGTVNTGLAGTYIVNYNVSDASGNAATQVSRTIIVTAPVVDTTAPVITLNGASTINLEVGDTYNELGATATDDTDGDLTSSIVITGTINTGLAGTYIVNYNVNDAAGNPATQVNRTIIITEPSTGSGCSGGISSFPYSESFENTLGAWTQESGDDFNWTVDASGTPSSNTGPSSASSGTYYVYMESSSPNYSTKRAILNSPCYDLSGETQATFNFQYHMYGATTMGSLALELSDDNGVSWTSVWSKSGNQGNSWQSGSVDLGAYTGNSVQLRFNGVTGSTWQGDMAVDAVSLTTSGGGGTTCSNANLSITFDNYPEETAWTLTNASGQTVASGGTYGSQADGSTLNINVGCLDDGCYDFTITDTYGDGICCSYGNGSYSLTNSDTGAVLASGGSFTSSEITNFCLGSSNFNYGFATTTITNDLDKQFKVYPNPVEQTLNLNLVGFEAQSFEVKNMLGQTVMQGRYKSTIDVSRFDAGVYVLQLNIGEKTKVKRFIKL